MDNRGIGMFKKLSSLIIVLSTISILCGCGYLRSHNPKQIMSGELLDDAGNKFDEICEECSDNPRSEAGSKFTKLNHAPVVVCRSQQCAPARLSMSKEYVYNALLQLLDNNNYSTALICRADDQTRTCLEDYVTLPVTVGIVPTNVYIDSVKITDMSVAKKKSNLQLILNYNLTYGGQVATCTPSQSILFVRDLDHILLEDNQYRCSMTTIGSSSVKTVFIIDYVDLDYGYIGGYYSIGLSGPAYGGGSGYMLLRFGKNAYPLAPVLQAPKSGGSRNANAVAGIDRNINSATGASSSSANNGVQVFPISKK